MDIRGLRKEQLQTCLDAVNSMPDYGGNVEFVHQHYKIPNPFYDPESEGWINRLPHTYASGDIRPLNKRGDRFSVRLKVKSARRPGSRVSQERYGYGSAQKRINAACWHVHRDFLQEVFDTNEDAKVISALATYDGREDFEYQFPYTYHGEGMSGPAPISDIGGACNCDEGDYPEFAVEGLTTEQYDMRQEIWAQGYTPSGAKQALKDPARAVRKGA